MATTLKQLEKRVSAVEKKLTRLMKESKTATVAQRNGKKIQRQAEPKVGWAAIARPGSWLAHQLAIQPEIKRLARQILKKRAMAGAPTDPRIIQEKMIERGVNPDDNEFTQELIRMREET
jgi:hypothetical protein